MDDGVHNHDFDWVVIGSGFGGSVSALRLSERGYSVCVLEAGRRFTSSDMPKSGWDVRNYIYAPKLGLNGLLRLSFFKNVAILSGAGVGGGSLVYAATLYRAGQSYLSQLSAAAGEPIDLDRHYHEAERMLGVTVNPVRHFRDEVTQRVSTKLGYGDTWQPTPIGIFRGEPGVTVDDPYFGGEGPARKGCIDCAGCVTGCPHDAKNSLDKNYLWLAERRGVHVKDSLQVTEVRPIGRADGSDGYVIIARPPGARSRRNEVILRARGVVFSAGPMGTNRLLGDNKLRGLLPFLSDQVGQSVRTNAESLCALTPRDRSVNLGDSGVAITSGVVPRPGIHLETVASGEHDDSLNLLFVPFTGDGTRLTRPLKMLGNAVRHPIDTARISNPIGWSRRTMIYGGMLSTEAKLSFETRKRAIRRGTKMTSVPDPEHPVPTFIPEIHEAVAAMAQELNAIPQTLAPEALFNIPVTGHVLGGAVISTSPGTGVVDGNHRVWGYRNMLVCDGSTIPWNPGVNPSLTIAAMTERAMSTVPAKSAETSPLAAKAI